LDTTRLLLAVVLSLGLIFLYQTLVLKRMPPPSNQQQAQNLAQSGASAVPSAAASPGEIAQPNPAEPVVTSSLPASSLRPAAPGTAERLLTVETDQYVAQITTHGGRIKSFRLKQYRETAAQQVAIRQAAVRSQEANLQGALAQLEQARLKLAYTKIVAPVSGIVMKRSAEVGAHVAPGQPLLTIAQTGDLWVTANFKETQLTSVWPGLRVRIHVDALQRDFDGYVENVAGGTGAVSSVLPPENATGNYVKVVQRIPVRLRFKPHQADLDLLRAGMSAEPEIRIAR